MSADFDIAIVGSGFAGSLLAMIARRLGHSVVLLERGQQPRFAIGESSTPLANLLLEEMVRRYELPRLLPLTKCGSWQKAYPNVGCGLKRGFTFYHHNFDRPWIETADHNNQLLVAASPHDGIADTHWYRPDFDHFLFKEAQSNGVECLERVNLGKPEPGAGGFSLRGEQQGKALLLKARYLIDASGARGFFYQSLGLPEQPFPHLPPTQALYTHFTGVRRLEEICPTAETPPYPVDDAAVHHVFEGGWIWVLRFNNGITSAGVAATATLANSLRLEEGAPGWQRLLQRLPTLREQFADAKAELPFIHVPQLSVRSRAAAGVGWALLPSAVGFVDPLLSTGFPLTLLGVARMAEIIERGWEPDPRLSNYSEQTFKELDAAELMVAALYANMNDFSIFSALSLLYFAAASFSETARRLGRPELAGSSFLLGDNPQFASQSRACFLRALQSLAPPEKQRLKAQIFKTIEPIDVAGLSGPARRNWFPVDARDLFKAAPKLRASEAEIQQLLARCGFVL